MDRPEDGQHTQQDLLDVHRCPPADAVDNQGKEHQELIEEHNGSRRHHLGILCRNLLLLLSHIIGCTHVKGRVIGILQLVKQEGIFFPFGSHTVIELLDIGNNLVIFLLYLCSLRLIKGIGIATDTVRDIRKQAKKTAVNVLGTDSRCSGRVPEHHNEGHAQHLQDLQHIQRLMPDLHLIGDTCSHDD